MSFPRSPTIYLVRHGETIWNAAGRFQGRLDSELTAKGRDQARALGMALANELGERQMEYVLKASPLGRAKTTATIIAEQMRDIFIEEDHLLVEVSIGSWDGLTHFEIDMECPDALRGASPFNWFFRAPDGECLDRAYGRAQKWLACVNSPTIAVSHGLFGRLVRGAYLSLSTADMLQLPVPQDGFFCLQNGEERFLPA
ncbi:histidine phosphatase family protein [Methylocystis heyeri]|uniref:Histidine phosphatase family protein n=1 Tax=Methylocystis heyeri TaxID=391905 RepID=A0A6B8KCY7_9HYPH|nr:histidine phosphatase family protein [Methylocystis heyeri]QGM46096.1 histidine phosphatase family protein [Methylocystis heyeri]